MQKIPPSSQFCAIHLISFAAAIVYNTLVASSFLIFFQGFSEQIGAVASCHHTPKRKLIRYGIHWNFQTALLKRFLLDTGKMDELDLSVEIWAIQVQA